MPSTVVHHPRVIWDAARAFVQAASGPHHAEFASEVLHRLGPELHAAVIKTSDHLAAEAVRTGGDRSAPDLEAGKWRIRLEEFLRSRPDLIEELRELTGQSHKS